MCVVSFIHDWGQQQPYDKWTQPGWDSFKELIEAAKKVDTITGQPDCEDANKMKWTEEVERRLQEKATQQLIQTVKDAIVSYDSLVRIDIGDHTTVVNDQSRVDDIFDTLRLALKALGN